MRGRRKQPRGEIVMEAKHLQELPRKKKTVVPGQTSQNIIATQNLVLDTPRSLGLTSQPEHELRVQSQTSL